MTRTIRTFSFCSAVVLGIAVAATAAAQSPSQAPPAQAPAATATPGSGGAPAGDANAGRLKTAMCQGCHEIPGWQTAFPETYKVPRIFGQHPAYIISALRAYKSGDRAHPSMRAIAASLSDRDMADLAAFYGGPPVRTAGK
ncbi:MAG: cytochrome c [Pseudomonadota bacterium]|nr:cytochrome c [Pseudomonadota bacterium]